MTRQFINFAAQVAVITGAIVGILRLLEVPTYWLKLTIAIGVGVLALSALVMALSNLPFRRGARADDGARAARAARRARARDLLRRFRGFVRELRRAQPWFRLWYRERSSVPLWLVLGPGGHGKSTLLLAAPGVREHARPNADLAIPEPRFFTSDGLAFLELADGDEDHPGLDALLRKLAGKRPLQPLAGILVVVRLDALTAPPPELLARTRSQILRVAAELAVRPPLILACTHLDRLAGFAEFCEGLTSLDRPLGVTLPACDTPQTVAQALQARSAEPLAWIRQRCHALIARPQPSAASQQSRLYSFWQQFDELSTRANACATFLAGLLLPGGESLRPRAVYYLSATAGNTPVEETWLELLANRAGGALPSLSPAAPVPAPAFVRGVFSTDLVRDSALATRLRPLRLRRAGRQALAGVAISGLAVYSTVAITEAAGRHHESMQSTWDAAKVLPQGSPRKPLSSTILADLRNAVERWRTSQPWHQDWGLFRQDLIQGPVLDVYTREVCRGVLRPIAQRSAEALRRFVDQHTDHSVPSVHQQREFADHLRLYTLLAKHTPQHPTWQGDELSWLSGHIRERWARDDHRDDAARLAVLQSHAELVQDRQPAPVPADLDPCVASRGALALALDERLVADTKRILGRLPPESQTLDRILGEVNRARRTTLASSPVTSRKTIAAAYTQQGWTEVTREIRSAAYDRPDDRWFLKDDDHTTDDPQQYCRALLDTYVGLYVKAWRDAIDGITIEFSSDLDGLERVLRALPADKALTDVFTRVSQNTQSLAPLYCPPKKIAGNVWSWLADRAMRASGTAPPAPDLERNAQSIAAEFAPFVAYGVAAAGPGKRAAADSGAQALDTYHGELRKLSQQLATARENPERLAGLKDAAKAARTTVLSEIDQGEYGPWADRLQRIVLPPIDGLLLTLDKQAADDLNRQWCRDVVLQLRDTLLHRYPFDPAARPPHAALADITRLFHPETGVIAKFREEHFQQFVEPSGTGITARVLGVDAPLRLDPSVVRFLDDAHKLGLLLPADDKGLEFTVKLVCSYNIRKLTLTVDGASTSYLCGPNKPQAIRWPGEKDPRGATLKAHGDRESGDEFFHPGSFGLFNLLERGKPQRRPGHHEFEATFTFVNYGEVTLTVNPQQTQGGSLVYGFDADAQFLAPVRTPSILHPPQTLFKGHPHSCSGAP